MSQPKPGTFIGLFEARPLPTAIWFFGEEVVAGPFCKHCGYPVSMHGAKVRRPRQRSWRDEPLACRDAPNAVLPPSCDCHEIKEGKIVRR